MHRSRTDWQQELGHWLAPFLERLGHKTRRGMCPLYVAGLIGPGDRKSVVSRSSQHGPPDRRPKMTPRIASRRNVTEAVVLRALMDCKAHRNLAAVAGRREGAA